MGLVGKSLYADKVKKKVRCPFTFSSSNEKKKKEPTLIELAEERFGKDRNLIMHLKTFLSSCAQKRQLPTRLAWSMQLQLLEKFPEEERAKQVTTSIMRGYRAIAYEGNLEKYKGTCQHKISMEKEDEENIVKEIAY